MAENAQVVMSWTANAELQIAGINQTGYDVQFGVGGGFLGPLLFNGQIWLRVQKLASTNNVFGNFYLNHSYLHWWLDPLSPGPAVTVRLEDLVIMEWLASTTARVFYGWGEFVTVTDPTSLRGLGFYADSGGNWFALANDASGDLLRVDTGVSSTAAHMLRMEMNCTTKIITWFVDDVQVATVTLVVALDQIATGTGNASGLLLVQVIQSNLEAANLYYAGGWQHQLTFITNEADVAGAGWTPCDGC